jgi:ABC-type thiamine transport system ATPase subunit
MSVIRTCVAIALVVNAANCVFAQQASSPAADLRNRLQHMHGTHSIDNELDRLTTTLQLSQQQRSEVEVLLVRHHDTIQALIDGNPNASDELLRERIHSISDDTHREINALLTQQQLVLVQQMQAQMREAGRGRYIDSLRNR